MSNQNILEIFCFFLSMLICLQLLFKRCIRGILLRFIHILVYHTLFKSGGCDVGYYPNDRTSFKSSPFLCRLIKQWKLSTTALFKVYLPNESSSKLYLLALKMTQFYDNIPGNFRKLRKKIKTPCVISL